MPAGECTPTCANPAPLQLVQEIAAHRKKHDMAVQAVAFHASRPLIGCAGADALVKVFSTAQSKAPPS